jgi:hypothetical protein
MRKMTRDCGWAGLGVALVLLGCGAEPGEPTVPASEPRAAPSSAPSAAPSIAPAPVTRTTASVAAPPPVIPEALSNAPRLVYRSFDTGVLNARSTLVTRTLQRFEDQALLTELTQTSNSSTFKPVIGPFDAPKIRRYLGTATTTGKVTTFTLTDGDTKLKLDCAMGDVKVAAATAVRASSGKGGCNGDRGHWVPAATKRVQALRCGIDETPPDPEYPPPDRFEEMAFTAPPGIEFLFVNDDCVMQGGGYRFVPANGEVGAIRTPGAL